MKLINLILISFLLFFISCGRNGGVAPDTTSASCAGVSVGGYCWYLGNQNESCTTVCASHGGYNNATDTYSGGAGTLVQCQSVLNALGRAGAAVDGGGCTGGYGCTYNYQVFQNIRCTAPPATTASAVDPDSERACACNN